MKAQTMLKIREITMRKRRTNDKLTCYNLKIYPFYIGKELFKSGFRAHQLVENLANSSLVFNFKISFLTVFFRNFTDNFS